MKLSDNYTKVIVLTKRSKSSQPGVYDHVKKLLYVFYPKGGMLAYTHNEIRELFELLNAGDGIYLDLYKLLGRGE